METINEIKRNILAKTAIDEAAVEQLQELIEAGNGIDKEKANLLFELKNSFQGKNNHSAWNRLFIDAITSFLLEDEDSPGMIDDSEAQWLRAKIQKDGKISKLDKDLLNNLKKKSINFPEMLHLKSKSLLYFEVVLCSTRFITFLAVIGSMVAAIVLFITSTLQIANGLIEYFDANAPHEHKELEHLVQIFVSSVDVYLIATVLLVFSMGVYELFINKIDVVNKQKDSRPNWLVVNSIDDLKSSLGKVILMILIVSFFKHSLNVKFETIYDLLFLGIGIILIAAALFLTHAHGGKHHKE